MRWLALPTLTLAACTAQPTAAPAPAPTTSATPSTATADARLVGRWTGVEGMYLVVGKTATPGRYTLEMQWDLDHRGTFEGTLAGDPGTPAIRFNRDGRTETLAPSDGAATGLKYLDGKRDCLTVRAGEGYCRS